MFYILYSFTVIFGTFVFHCNISATSGKSCMRSAIFENQRNLLTSKEIISVFSTTRTRSATRCSLLCLSLTHDCQSFRYDITSKSCELSGRLGLEKRGSHRAYTLRPTVRDCQDILGSGGSGLYPIAKTGRNALLLYCDMDRPTGEGGWTVFQRHEGDSVDFYRSWEEYKNGFGNVCGEFWLGNDNIHEMTSSGKYNLRIDMKTDSGAYYSVHESFKIRNESEDYTLEVGDELNGNMVNVMVHHRGHGFTTHDVDNDDKNTKNCAQQYKGGWWYYSCYACHLNGKYGYSFQCFIGDFNTFENLRWSEMKMKRNL